MARAKSITKESTKSVMISEPVTALKKVVYTTPEEFTELLQKFNGNIKAIAAHKNWELKALNNRIRHYMPYCDIYEKYVDEDTRLVDNKVRKKVNALKEKIMKGFEALLDSGNEKAILQGVKDLITPIIHKQETEDINIQVNTIERSPIEVKELAQKLIDTESVEKI